ncbi:hypothetical protein [Streptomyces sp. Ru73]|uniref:hypothetical protein n=1 Tax=Streptomyces sp. Ru73 TaxID=2080748 RepID=UPI0015E343E5|nr:hypothetical protein [Streptomyces sp. Ru73]
MSGALLILLFLAAAPAFRTFFDFTAGVLTLVSLTAAVVWGLLSTGRTVLEPRTRLLAQGVHRALATASLGFLVLHITVKVAEAHALFLDALVPFASVVLTGPVAPGTAPLIGFGTLAGLLMVLAAATGALRSAFAGRGRVSGRWRALHTSAYAAWCLALVHGLKSGRAPAGWVTAGYALCLAAVMGALLTRFLFTPCARFPYLTLRRDLPFSLPLPLRARKPGRRRTGRRAAARTSTGTRAAPEARTDAPPWETTTGPPMNAAQDAPSLDAAQVVPSGGAAHDAPSWDLADAPTQTLPYVTAPYAAPGDAFMAGDGAAPEGGFAPDGAPTEHLSHAGLGAAPHASESPHASEWAGPPTLVQPTVPGGRPEGAPLPPVPNGWAP